MYCCSFSVYDLKGIVPEGSQCWAWAGNIISPLGIWHQFLGNVPELSLPASNLLDALLWRQCRSQHSSNPKPCRLGFVMRYSSLCSRLERLSWYMYHLAVTHSHPTWDRGVCQEALAAASMALQVCCFSTDSFSPSFHVRLSQMIWSCQP